MDFLCLFTFFSTLQINFIVIRTESKIIFSALNSMLEAVHVEQHLVTAIESFHTQRESKLGVVKRVYERWLQHHRDTERRIGNEESVITTKIKLILRITQYWSKLKTFFLDKMEERYSLQYIYSGYERYIPDEKDLRGFSRLIITSSDVYEKSFSELLTPRSAYVTADEILELSQRIVSHQLGHSPHDSLLKASELGHYALTEFGGTPNTSFFLTQERFTYLSYITESLYRTGYWEVGFNLCKTINRLFPDIKEFDLKRKLFRSRWKEGSQMGSMKEARDLRRRENPDTDSFGKLCRRRNLVLPTGPELKCYFFHKNPHLRHFAGYKLEEVSHSPLIRVYHDVLLDGEIYMLQNISFDLLDAAKVVNPLNRSINLSTARVSNNGWLYNPDRSTSPHQSPEAATLYRTLNQRLEDCTSLSKEGVGSIQMNNYGVGGYFLVHFDPLFNIPGLDHYPNDRIATWMFYLNDVEEGGNTVFPRVNVAVPPEKGAAVFWYNLHPSGKTDYRTLHGGCPILRGTKWVANLWVDEHQQIFVRPCPLQPEPDTLYYGVNQVSKVRWSQG